jgi:histidine triad (HIT) family protein
VTVIGLEVPHAHIHLIPIVNESDMYFNNPRKEFTAKEFEAIAAAISGHLD